MTHQYTILLGGLVLPGGDEPEATAIAWASDTVLAIGDDESVRAISRGDSRFVDLHGACVVPAAEVLEVGGPADLVVVEADPRPAASSTARTLAVIRGGEVVEGSLPAGTAALADHAP